MASSKPFHILITGAASGVGRGLALYMARLGHRILLTDRDEAGLCESCRLIDAENLSCAFEVLDVTSSREIDALADRLEKPVDVLINNAGLQFVSPIDEFPEQKWDSLIDVMLKGPYLLVKAFLPGMKEQNFGRIINIGSIHAQIASPYKSAYISAKHGLLGLSKTVALETATYDITINTICPAYVHTPLVDTQIDAQARANNITREEVIEKIMLAPMPKKAFITIEEIAGTCEYLMSPASRNMTGQTITLDGGWTAR